MTSLQRNCLTGPHTFIASSFTSTHSPCGLSVETNAIKASVPKLFNCPGSRFPRPLSRAGQRCGVSAALRTYNIVGSLLTSVASDTDNSSSRSHWPCPALSPLGSRAVQKHNPSLPLRATSQVKKGLLAAVRVEAGLHPNHEDARAWRHLLRPPQENQPIPSRHPE